MESLETVVGWLSLPLSGAVDHRIAMWAAWHGRLMVAGWGLMIPVGILIARYGKITPGQNWPDQLDNKFWWRWHRRLQYAGCAAMLIGLGLSYGNAEQATPLAILHRLMGWTVVVLGVTQMASGLLRGSKGGPTGVGTSRADLRGDHYDMTSRRYLFEYVHKFGGLIALGLSVVTLIFGLVVADAPRWMLLMLASWWLCLLGVTVYLQRKGRCVDTYQAIWGADPVHPGNSRKVVGIGVRRREGATTRQR